MSTKISKIGGSIEDYIKTPSGNRKTKFLYSKILAQVLEFKRDESMEVQRPF